MSKRWGSDYVVTEHRDLQVRCPSQYDRIYASLSGRNVRLDLGHNNTEMFPIDKPTFFHPQANTMAVDATGNYVLLAG